MKTDGDIREMLRTIFFFDRIYTRPKPCNQKTKTPFELAVSAIRALDGASEGSRQLAESIARMGQPLYQYQPPTGFPDRSDHWISNGSVVERLNFAIALTAEPDSRYDCERRRTSKGSSDETGFAGVSKEVEMQFIDTRRYFLKTTGLAMASFAAAPSFLS